MEMRGGCSRRRRCLDDARGKSARGNKDEAHGETTELRLEVEVWKQEEEFRGEGAAGGSRERDVG